jgi:ribosome-binding factor A
MSYRPEQAAEHVTHLAAQYLSREAGRTTLLTATRTDLSLNGRQAMIYVSVFPESENKHALTFLGRHEQSFRDFLKKEARLSTLPFIKFVIDPGEANRAILEELAKSLPPEDPESV